MANNLVEVRREDLPILRNMYKSKGSKGYIGYMTLGNYISWFEQDPNVRHIKVFCLNGDFADGAFVVTVNMSINFLLSIIFKYLLRQI